MFIHRRRGWEIPESHVTPEALVVGRRAVLAGTAAAAAGGIAGPAEAAWTLFGGKKGSPLELKPLTARHNPRYEGGRAVTDEREPTSYNNYYDYH